MIKNFNGTQWFFKIGLAFFVANSTFAAEVFKYKDANGKWHYTDKKPKQPDAESLSYKVDKKTDIEPRLFTQANEKQNLLMVENPFHAPIELMIKSVQISAAQERQVIPALATQKIIENAGAIEKLTYSWMPGDPASIPQTQLYNIPVDTLTCPKISQSFHGKFSHNKPQSEYAVDIALQIGSNIIAAQDGVVFFAKDDYHMGGVNNYFLDKANGIMVFHADGTFASYGHILLGTAAVKVGDKVTKGTLLAKSGSSGFSSGPHLHFVIYRNQGMKFESIPFQFVNAKGNAFVPVEGKTVCDF
jgi:murein DD-endopeptidase MepM/ murein hydrolase activator NlpD